LVLVLAYGGLRFGEAAALRVRRVDVPRGRGPGRDRTFDRGIM